MNERDEESARRGAARRGFGIRFCFAFLSSVVFYSTGRTFLLLLLSLFLFDIPPVYVRTIRERTLSVS